MSNSEIQFLTARIEALEQKNIEQKNALKSIILHLDNLPSAALMDKDKIISEVKIIAKNTID